MQPTTHLTRHATSDTTSEKNASNSPVMIAPITLVAANVTPKRTIDISIAPRIAIKRIGRILHTQPVIPALRIATLVTSVIARYTTAIPKTTHKKAGVTAITALKVKKAVIMPMIMLATIATPTQLHLEQ